jgi:RNA polymerase sigma factor (sigma-70 family)
MTDNTSNTNKANTPSQKQTSPNILTWNNLIVHAYKIFYSKLVKYCGSKLKDSTIDKSIQAEDVVQHIYTNFTKMVQEEKVDHRHDPWLLAYLKRSCENYIIDLIKKDKLGRKVWSETKKSLTSNLSEADRNNHISDIDLINRIQSQTTTDTSEKKKYEHLMLSAQWYSYQEIAEMCGLKIWTIKGKISRQRQELNTILTQTWEYSDLVLHSDESKRSRAKKYGRILEKSKPSKIDSQ